MAAPKLTAKQEKFCQEYIKCGNQSEAYRQAYDVSKNTKDKTIWNDAYKLMLNPDVNTRVYELQEKALERTLVTVESLTIELEEARAMAQDTGQPSAMTSASMGKAKIHGFDVQKHQVEASFSVSIDADNKDL